MVRREGIAAGPAGSSVEEGVPCCIFPAGESPVWVSVGAPSSRPPSRVERPDGEAWCRKPSAAKAVRGKQVRGPQHQVKPAASSELQRESRAEHVAAKAMSVADESECEATLLSGVWGAARGHGEMRNSRGPSALRSEPRGARYKPTVKSGAVQRESEGAVVLAMAAQNNAAGGKGPCFSHARQVGTCEGMLAEGRSQTPLHPNGCSQSTPAECLAIGGGQAGSLAHAFPRRLSVSRMREIRTYGLKGGPAFLLLSLSDLQGGRIYQ